MGLFGKRRESDDGDLDLLPELQSLFVLQVTRDNLLPVVERALPAADALLAAKVRQMEDGAFPYLFSPDLELLDAGFLTHTIEQLLEWTSGRGDSRGDSHMIPVRTTDGTFAKDDTAREIAAQGDFYVALSRREFVSRCFGRDGAQRIAAELDLLPHGDETWLFVRAAAEAFTGVVSKGIAKRAKKARRRQ